MPKLIFQILSFSILMISSCGGEESVDPRHDYALKLTYVTHDRESYDTFNNSRKFLIDLESQEEKEIPNYHNSTLIDGKMYYHDPEAGSIMKYDFITEEISMFFSHPGHSWNLSPDLNLLTFTVDQALWMKEIESSLEWPLGSTNKSYINPIFSPDGLKILVSWSETIVEDRYITYRGHSVLDLLENIEYLVPNVSDDIHYHPYAIWGSSSDEVLFNLNSETFLFEIKEDKVTKAFPEGGLVKNVLYSPDRNYMAFMKENRLLIYNRSSSEMFEVSTEHWTREFSFNSTSTSFAFDNDQLSIHLYNLLTHESTVVIQAQNDGIIGSSAFVH